MVYINFKKVSIKYESHNSYLKLDLQSFQVIHLFCRLFCCWSFINKTPKKMGFILRHARILFKLSLHFIESGNLLHLISYKRYCKSWKIYFLKFFYLVRMLKNFCHGQARLVTWEFYFVAMPLYFIYSFLCSWFFIYVKRELFNLEF